MIRLLILFVLLLCRFSSNAQTLQQDLELPYLVRVPQAAKAQAPMVLLLHGYGSNETDLFELKDIFPASFIVVSARAPQSAGNEGWQWYQMRMNNGRRDADAKELEQVTARLRKLVQQLVARYHADPRQVYVMGFSQGGIMSYQLALHHPELLRGAGIWSGRLLPASQQHISSDPALKKLRFFIAHGTADKVIPFSDAAAARDYLLGLGLKPEFHSYKDMQHQISQQEISDIRNWITAP